MVQTKGVIKWGRDERVFKFLFRLSCHDGTLTDAL